MDYTKREFEETVAKFGEVFFVLDSDREYQVHGTEGYDFSRQGGAWMIRVEGMQGEEYIVAEFPLDAVEHHYTHKEV